MKSPKIRIRIRPPLAGTVQRLSNATQKGARISVETIGNMALEIGLPAVEKKILELVKAA